MIMVRFCTYARGLGDFTKRKQLFTLIKLKKLDFVLIQESHLTDRDSNIWRSQWGGEMLYANGVSDSRGVLILINRLIDYKIGKVVTDLNGRYIISEFTIDNFTFVICNIYAPNVDSPDFFKKIEMEIELFDNSNIMVAGNFNFAIDPEIDRKISHYNNNKARDTFLSYAEFRELVDVWRVRNPDARQYSCCRPNSDSHDWHKMSRIDMIFMSFGMMNFVRSCRMSTGYRSDHSFVICDLQFSYAQKGPGFWKFNSSFLFDKQFLVASNAIIEEEIWKSSQVSLTPEFRWLKVKGALIEFSKMYGRDKARDRNKRIIEIEEQLDKIKTLYDALPCPNSELSVERDSLEKERKEIIQNRVNGIIIRTREKFFAEGERSSKYYFSLERHNASKKTMFSVKDEQGIITSDQTKIHQIQVNYFNKLYSPDKRANFNLENQSTNKLTEKARKELDRKLEYEEIINSIKSLPNNKSPGLDGLPIEVYKVFWSKIKEIFMDSILYLKEQGKLSKCMRQGVIGLIPKKDKDPLLVANWRPITMLTCEYKIIAKALAMHMQNVLPDIIHPDQTGFMQGRNIADNIRKTIEIVNYAHKRRVEFLIMTIDYQKCFDFLQHETLWGCLRYLNFGEEFITWVKLLYCNIELFACNFGYLSAPIQVNRSVLQGSPIAAFLFLSAGQILHDLITNNPKIRGMKIRDIELLIAQFADDTTLFLQYDKFVLEAVAETFDRISDLTGLIVNYDKTNIYRVGSLADTDAKIYTTKMFNWTNDPISLLGVKIPTTPNEQLTHFLNFENILQKTTNIIKLWSLRAPTLSGRILIVNSLIGSLFVYKWQVFPNMSVDYVLRINEYIRDFIWNNKRSKIAFNILTKDRKQGGLRLIDIIMRQQSLKIQWIYRIENNPIWTTIFYDSLLWDIDSLICNLDPKHAKLIFKDDTDPFWIHTFQACNIYNVSRLICQPVMR